MRQERCVLADRIWTMIEPLLPVTSRGRGCTAKTNRLFLGAVWWRLRDGGPWRDLPPGLGAWDSLFRCFRRRVQAGVFDRIFEAISGEPDLEYVLIDGAIISTHRKASGANGGLIIRPSAVQKTDGRRKSWR